MHIQSVVARLKVELKPLTTNGTRLVKVLATPILAFRRARSLMSLVVLKATDPSAMHQYALVPGYTYRFVVSFRGVSTEDGVQCYRTDCRPLPTATQYPFSHDDGPLQDKTPSAGTSS